MIQDLLRIMGQEHRRSLIGYFVWCVAYAVLQGVAMVMIVPVLQDLLAGDIGGALAWLSVLVCAALFACIAHYVQAMRGFEVALTVLSSMHHQMGDHVVGLPLGWFSSEKIGRLSQTLTSGTMMIGGLFAHLLTPLVTGIVTPATIAVAMFFFDWRLAAAVIICSPVLYLAFRWSASLVGRGDELTDAAAVEAGNRVVEFARCQLALRAFGRGVEGYQPLEDAIEGQRIVGRRSLWMAVPGLIAGGFAAQLAFTVLIAVGVLLALGGSVDTVQVIALLALSARFTGPLSEVAEFAGALRMGRNDVRRMARILAEQPLPEPAEAVVVSARGEIELDGVTFGYEPGRPVLRDVSLRVPPRTMTALVGASGSGKTTVTRLIARFWDVDSGTVRVGGADVRDLTTDALMAQVAMVFQDVYLFDDTLEANIRVGRADATDAEVRKAGRLAGVQEIVERLPAGWATRVGEGGTSLSGGERQRVSVARAILKDAPIVLLDEATAALDPENERFVQDALRTLQSRSTLLVIAHKLPTVVAADQIVVLDDGGIVEHGTHGELLAADGRYAEFWRERSRARGWRLAAENRPRERTES
ncbi:ABC transporter ATP-binding protein [Pseudonocardia sp. TRM90224]|uniref:ABC transporter ATP-binding protein n=1 Tax=Pseudonocardia sp. TRM90224 TaxID=2812678 RepID=UPI001E2E9978|nr:ABC transporter ATP-binding protein [Pseudonocardia sp. TRM90224]